MGDPVEEAKKKKLPLKSGPPTVLTITVVRARTGERVPNAEITVEGLTGAARRARPNPKDGITTVVLTGPEVDGVTSVKVTARLLIPGGAAHGATHQEGTETVTLKVGGANPVTVRLVNPCLAAFPDPATDAILARNLTLREARDTLVRLHALDELTLTNDPNFRHDAGVCSVVTPTDTNTDRIGMKGAPMAKTVEYRTLFTFDFVKRTVGTHSAGDLLALQHRNAVGLFRLARFLGRDAGFNIKKIFHPGISGSAAFVPKAGPGNRHTRGHCIDFSGVEGIEGTGPDVGKAFVLTVLFDWGGAPVPALDPKSPNPRKPAVLAPVAFSPSNITWPAGDTDTLPYRLEHVRGKNDPARLFFEDIYHFFNREWADVSQVPGTVRAAVADTQPGEMLGRTIHPDYGKEDKGGQGGREAHQNHIHAEMPDDLPDP